MLDSLFVYTLRHLHIDRAIALDIDQRLVITSLEILLPPL